MRLLVELWPFEQLSRIRMNKYVLRASQRGECQWAIIRPISSERNDMCHRTVM